MRRRYLFEEHLLVWMKQKMAKMQRCKDIKLWRYFFLVVLLILAVCPRDLFEIQIVIPSSFISKSEWKQLQTIWNLNNLHFRIESTQPRKNFLVNRIKLQYNISDHGLCVYWWEGATSHPKLWFDYFVLFTSWLVWNHDPETLQGHWNWNGMYG